MSGSEKIFVAPNLLELKVRKFMDQSAWMSIAFQEVGVSTYPPGQSNPRITEYHERTNIAGYDDKASWCSSFVNWTLAQVGITGTNSALARSWLKWGESLSQPIPGCIVVLSREDPTGWKGHVGFFLHVDEEHIHLLGGNQLDQVREHFYASSSVLGYRWPARPIASRDQLPLWVQSGLTVVR